MNADVDAVQSVTQEAARAFGGLDVVRRERWHGAARGLNLCRAAADELERVMAVNATGLWNTVRASRPHDDQLQARRLGAVMAGTLIPSPRWPTRRCSVEGDLLVAARAEAMFTG